jgi:translation initiation factor IF-2
LAELNVLVEDWGGKVISVPVSAKTGQGLDQLLDMTLLLAEVENYRANPKGQVVGTVIDSRVSRGQGSVATIIVQNGTLKVGDLIVAGSAYGRIKGLEDSKDVKITKAGPSTPALVIGLSELPAVGDIFREVQSLDEARTAAKEQERYARTKSLMNPGIVATGKVLNLVVKADVQGSLQAIEQALEELKSRTEEVQLTIVDKSVGEINETDILRAESANATIIGFHSRPTASAANLAKNKKVTIDIYEVIYELLEDVTKALVAMLAPEVIESVVGVAKILAVFKTESDGQIIGGRVEDGKALDKVRFKVRRGDDEVGTGQITELQRNKQKASEVVSGSEFGLKIKSTVPVAVGDVLEFYTEEVRARKLE